MKGYMALFTVTALLMLLVPMTVLDSLHGPAQPDSESRQPTTPTVANPESAGTESSPEPSQEPPAEPDNIYKEAPTSFKILNSSTGKVEEISVQDFVRGAVAAEMPALYHTEALKAQGVAAYTYAVRAAQQQRANPNPALKGADFEADPQNLKVYITQTQAKAFYGDQFTVYWDKVCTAADAVLGYILLYQGQPIGAAYHAISAGSTEDSSNIWDGEELPYLQAVDSEGDILSPGYESQVQLTTTQLKAALETAFPQAKLGSDPSQWLVVEQRSPAGYITQISVGGQSVHGKQVRTALNLRSSHFTVAIKDKAVTITVLGYGHGAGLSQNGADYMARQGSSFDEILLHYYTDVQLGLVQG